MSLGTGHWRSSAVPSRSSVHDNDDGRGHRRSGLQRTVGHRRSDDGFISAYVNVRIVSPAVAGIGLAATIGAGATAQLGAMRIADEIDALEVMAVRSVAYLVSTGWSPAWWW